MDCKLLAARFRADHIGYRVYLVFEFLEADLGGASALAKQMKLVLAQGVGPSRDAGLAVSY
jgi:hypothetical protein